MGLEKKLADLEAALDGYVTKDDFEYVVNVTNKLSSDIFSIQRNYGKRIEKLEGAASGYALKEDLAALKSTINQDIEVIFDQIDSNVFDIMDLEKKVEELDNALKATNEELAALKAEVVTPDQLAERLMLLYKKISFVEENTNKQIEGLNKKIEENANASAAAVADLETKLEAYGKNTNLALILSFVSTALTVAVLLLGQ